MRALLIDLYPKSVDEWDHERNTGIDIRTVSPKSNRKAWWLCDKGHSYEQEIAAHTSGQGCPYCSGRSVLKGFNDLQTRFPELVIEWDYDKNDLTPDSLTSGSSTKVWWKCSECSHEWRTSVSHRVSGRGCPACARESRAKKLSKKNLIIGETDLLTTHPKLSEEWDYERNASENGLTPKDVTRKSSQNVWWKCPVCSNSYLATISNRTGGKDKIGTGCPYCSGRRPIKGKTDLKTLRPDIAAEWDTNRNGSGPEEYTVASDKPVYWICDKGHSYSMPISKKTTGGYGCPICAGKRVLAGFNDLASQRPDLLKEWDYEHNTILPTQITAKSQRRVAWICEKGHRWVTSPDLREAGTGCPVCANRKLLVGYNDLKTLFPEVAEDWDYEKNDTSPEDHIAGTHTKVWWKCHKCGHEWRAGIKDRAYSNNGCPNCTFYYKTSTPEQAVYYYIKRSFPDAVNSYKPEGFGRMEFDVFVPSLKLAIEYDGLNWHQKRDNGDRDRKKSELVRSSGLELIRIKEGSAENKYGDLAVIDTAYNDRLQQLQPALIRLFDVINDRFDLEIKSDIDVDRDASEIYALSQGIIKGKTLSGSGSDVLKEWNYERNGGLTPDKFTVGSRKKVWWRCSSCGKEWGQTAKTKVEGGLYCESCSKSRALNKRAEDRIKAGKVKSVADYPNLLVEWDDDRSPDTVARGSSYKAHWKCIICGNEFDMIVKARTGQGQGCPICARKGLRRNSLRGE